jgi:hypothetical protein
VDVARARDLAKQLLSALGEEPVTYSPVARPTVPVSDLDRLAHAGARIRPNDRGQWQLLLDEHGLVKLEIAVRAVKPAYIEDVRAHIKPVKRLKSWDEVETILRNSALPHGEKQLEEWSALGKGVACCTSAEEWIEFVLWAICESEKKGEDFKYGNQFRGYALTWRRDHHERWVSRRSKEDVLRAQPGADPRQAEGAQGGDDADSAGDVPRSGTHSGSSVP